MPPKALRLIALFEFKQPAQRVIGVLLAGPVFYRVAPAHMGAADILDKCPVFALVAVVPEDVVSWPLEFSCHFSFCPRISAPRAAYIPVKGGIAHEMREDDSLPP